jgi:serine/threonine-protein kinase
MKFIGKYRIRGLLGRGGMAKVLKVEHPVIGKISALKLLDPDPVVLDLMGEDAVRRLFLNEAATLARLRHPHIVEILDYDESAGKPYYLMDYYVNNLGVMIGESFRPDRPSRRIRIEKAVDYTRQTLKGLACLHHADIVHRDIKPYNLLITDQDTIKICDFGLSKLRGEEFAGPRGLKVGSAWYAAPEQEDDPNRVDATADLYSVGVALYRMLTGRLSRDASATVSNINPDLDPSWDRFVRRALSPQQHQRFPSASRMLDELEGLALQWEEKKARICRLPPVPSAAAEPKAAGGRLRRQCIKIGPEAAARCFGTDELRRPARYVANAFVGETDAVVRDDATGLLWQQSGCEFPVNWKDAHAYIEKLNAGSFAGFRAWRMPTVNELMSLLTEVPQVEDYCIQPLFDSAQKWLWSCDRRSFTAAWYVSVDLGFVAWQDFSAYFYVRAVRNIKDDD